MSHRPEGFRIDYAHPLGRGLVFAGLGRSPGSTLYHDSSSYQNSGALTNMDPATDWMWVPELGRWAMDFDGSDDRVVFPGANYGTSWSASYWINYRDVSVSVIWGGEYGNYLNYISGNTPSDLIYHSVTSMYVGVIHGGLTSGLWYNFVTLRNQTSVQFFKNGFQIGTTQTLEANNPLIASAIGSYSDGLFPTDMQLADPCVWNRILSPSEIQSLADRSDSMLGGLILPPRRRLWGVKELESSSSSLSTSSSSSSTSSVSSSSSSSSSTSASTSSSSSSTSESSSSVSTSSSSSSILERGRWVVEEGQSWVFGPAKAIIRTGLEEGAVFVGGAAAGWG